MAKAKDFEKLVVAIAVACSVNPEDVAAINADGTAAVIITQVNAYKVTINAKGEVQLPEGFKPVVSVPVVVAPDSAPVAVATEVAA
jgi:hypothetical protein